MSGNDDAQNLSPESKAFKFGLDVINQSEPQIADYIRAELENQRSPQIDRLRKLRFSCCSPCNGELV